MADKNSFPKIPESNWWTLRVQFQKTLPAQVTKGYLKSLLGLTSEDAAQNLISPLRQLGLIDDDGRPTQRANDWRSDSKYSETCLKMIKEIYPQELIDLYSGENLDRSTVKEWFMYNGSLGDAAARQVTAMYLLLNNANPKGLEETKKNPAKKTEKQGNGKKIDITTKKKIENSNIGDSSDEVGSESGNSFVGNNNTTFLHPTPSLHIDLQIHISPDANNDQIETIFASIAKYLYKQ